MKILFAAALATMALVSSADVALAQYDEAVPIRRNYYGQPQCPRDYVVQDNVCLSIYSRRFRGDYGGALPQRRGFGPVVEPLATPRGLQCPTDYVLDEANNCVSIYVRRRRYY